MTIHSSLRDAARRAYLSVTRGTLVKSDDSKKMQEVEVRGLFGEKFKGVENWQPYGFSAHAKVPADGQGEAEVLLLNVGGTGSHPVVIGIADRRHRPQNLAEGEVALHDDQGNTVHIKRAGILVNAGSGKTVTLTAAGATVVIDASGNVNIAPGGSGKVMMG